MNTTKFDIYETIDKTNWTEVNIRDSPITNESNCLENTEGKYVKCHQGARHFLKFELKKDALMFKLRYNANI